MKPESSEATFVEHIEKSGRELATLDPMLGISLMLNWYALERAEGCPLDQDGDMLLFQWDVHNWGQERFVLNITRQFIEVGGDDEADGTMSQLSLSFFFEPDQVLRGLPEGNQWCTNPAELATFREFIEGCQAWAAVRQREPASVTLDFSEV